MIKKTFKITDMHCPNCSMILELIEYKLPGIKEINASYKKGEMAVEFDETQLSEAEILAAVEKKGYHIG